MTEDDNGLDAERRRFLEASLGTGITAMIAGCGGGGDGGGTPTPRVETVIRERTVEVTPEEGVEYELVPRFTFQTLPRSNDPTAFEHTVMARNQLAQLGLRFDFEVLETRAWVEDLFARNWDFNRLTWFGTVERSYPYYNLFFSFHSQFANESGGNFQMWESEEYDEVVEQFNEAFDPEEQQEYAFKAQEIIGLNQPVLFTVHPDTLVAANTQDFTNWQPMFGTNVYFNINSLRDLETTGDADAVIFGTTSAQESYPNFFAVTGNSLETHKMVYDTPVAYDYDGSLYGLAAEDWTVQDDTTIDVTLRDDMTWHDGEDVTGEDLKWTWDAVKEYTVPYIGSDVAPYESSELLDEYTVR
ncbi:MAG: ABC transporter substrate-binding protein, partial [Halobacteriales archaeon]|nr:ABC transporter substrate-binding protein [Halobacteriales archaeon]